MNVLHAPFSYFPDPAGGTEVYVEALARQQRAMGMAPSIAAPGREDAEYLHDGSPVHRFGVSPSLTLREMYGEGDALAAEAFGRILERVQPDVAHLHGFTTALSMRVVRRVREAGIPLVFTYHTPAATCVRGSLLHWGATPCDGQMDHRKCAACVIHYNGVPKGGSMILASVPSAAGEFLGAHGCEGSAWTALRATELLKLRHRVARELFQEADAVVAVCEWVKRVLLGNGVESEKIVVCRQGLAGEPQPFAGELRPDGEGAVRIAFLGRVHRVKGLDVLIDAMRLVPDLPLSLDIFAVAQGEGGIKLRESLIERSRGDGRIRFQAPLPPDRVIGRLREYDALAVPSLWLETGPLVVYEAFAAATPVIGSDLGGIAELVRHEENGLLVKAQSPADWADALRRLTEEQGLISRLRRGIGPVRTMRDVAAEMQAVYARALKPAGLAHSV